MAEETELAQLIGRELRELRMFRGMSARDVDRIIGWRENKTTEIERGSATPRFTDIQRYVALFGYSLDEFMNLLETRRKYEQDQLRSRVSMTPSGGKASCLEIPIDLGLLMVSPGPRDEFLVEKVG